MMTINIKDTKYSRQNADGREAPRDVMIKNDTETLEHHLVLLLDQGHYTKVEAFTLLVTILYTFCHYYGYVFRVNTIQVFRYVSDKMYTVMFQNGERGGEE